MKAVVQDRYGPPDVLEIGDVPTPTIGTDEVLVRVHAAGVDPGVWHLMTGLPYLVRVMGFGLRRPKARVPGSDFSGRVESVGSAVTRFRPGDDVFGIGDGAFAEYVRVRERTVARKPANLDFVQAAAVPTSAVTALQGIRDVAEVAQGQTVLIVGAAGGVGTFAVQIAGALGAEVTGVCSTTKADLVRSLGAAHVIDYTREEFTDGERRWDVVFDTAGNRPLSHLRRALAAEGTLVIVGGERGGRWFGGMERQLGALLLSRFVRQRLRSFIASARQADLEYLRGLLEAGTITPVVERTWTLDQAPDAIRHLAAGRARGKQVITI